jgi:hypothetical protein
MTPEDFKPDHLVPGTRIGAYVVRGLLGQGGTSATIPIAAQRSSSQQRRHSGSEGSSAATKA